MKLLMLIFLSLNCYASTYLKLDVDNETILGHSSTPVDGFTVQISEKPRVLVNDKWEYIYKYLDGELILLSQGEIEAHPSYVIKQQRIRDRAAHRKKIFDARTRIKAQDCDALSGIDKDYCIVLKRE